MQLTAVQTIHVSHFFGKKKIYPKAKIPLDKYPKDDGIPVRKIMRGS